ncbi:late control protein D [Vibrio zhanjiangensis]|uniref:Late control protein D n=1 Tax=Vibrio zhanjiangensis TaxID=1046128 RepID=A0ABQ6F4S2_9VIBR|nr:contractile injection system protein, VgrG/Pvc8 family [Vibrio zhanjiangensis]GLT20545.1 late control protein D [Vibrio zhanjiangensis]
MERVVNYAPAYRIEANDNDITNSIQDSFISMTITDNEGGEADSLSITLDGSKIKKMPTKKAKLKIALGFEDRLYPQGIFSVSNFSESGFPERVVISGTSIPMGGFSDLDSIQTQRTQIWESITLSNLLHIVASRNGLKPMIDNELGLQNIEHIDQTAESDMALMTRIAKQFGLVSKVSNDNWMILKKGEGKNARGTKAISHSIHKSDVSDYSFSSSTREESCIVEARWQDIENGTKGTVSAGSGSTVFQIAYTYPNEDEALIACNARANSQSSDNDTFDFTTSNRRGFIKAFSTGHLTASGWRAEISNCTWKIIRITKSIDRNGGLTVSVSANKVV